MSENTTPGSCRTNTYAVTSHETRTVPGLRSRCVHIASCRPRLPASTEGRTPARGEGDRETGSFNLDLLTSLTSLAQI